ncbi:MAG: tRNA (guanosine(46)-N7)-methyltransferase TrmB [Clostridia bacterium]|nr:tRNA (guanosine(46)-N7)-methyltransferase TrmB [Clostridia bacterium]
MRIRKKRHLEERLSAVKDYLIVPERDIPNVLEAVKDKRYFNFKEIFGNDNPVEMEIGCGKGGFIIQKAIENPNVNFLAVELLQNIVVMACESAKEKNLTNVKFVNSGAEYLPRYIPDGSMRNIYLNFSPPFPQDGYEGRRLTSDRFVTAYKNYLSDGGAVYQKTDDVPFFEYSFGKFLQFGFDVKVVSDQIEKGEIKNIETEYEKKFHAIGIRTNALIATKKPN